MKCMYYLAPTLVSTNQISDDLHEVGVEDWYVHIRSKDGAGIKHEKLHSSNWLETKDLLRNGFIGANMGFIVGVLAAGGIMLFEPFGPNFPGIACAKKIRVFTNLTWIWCRENGPNSKSRCPVKRQNCSCMTLISPA